MLLGAQNYLSELDSRDLPIVCGYAKIPDSLVSIEFLEAAQTIMDEQYLSMPSNIEEALDLYVTLVTTIEEFVT